MMTPNHPAIMAAEYNRTARTQEAQQHRLVVEAGINAERQIARRRVVNIVVSSVKFVATLVSAS